MIASKYRFHGHNSLRYVYSKGKAVRSQLCTIKYTPNKHREFPRFAVVISKKVIKSAIGRNRVRRRIFEYLRINTQQLSSPFDIVVICTSGELRDMPYEELKTQLDQLFIKAELYKSSDN